MKHLKFLLKILPLIALLAIHNTNAESSAGNTSTCTPTTTNNYVPCDAGYTGRKFTTTTKTCPDGWPNGIIKTTTTYDTSHCLRNIPPPPSGDRTCELTPGACAPTPASPGCPGGQHWVLTGSTVAHCVNNDPACGWGTSLVHDGMGNPSCIANTCPSNQVLQANGISCACAGGTVWNGSSCVALPPPCTPSVINGGNVACGAGFTGLRHGVTTTSCPGSVVTFAWDTSGCVPIILPPSCTPSVVNGSNIACGAGFTGAKFLVTTNACPGNIISSAWNTSGCVPIVLPPPCTPSSVIGSNVICDAGLTGFKHGVTTTSCPGNVVTFAWDTSACVALPPPCTPSTVNGSNVACGTGFTGSKFLVTTNTCPGNILSSVWDTSACAVIIPPSCANGASNYPTCTFPPVQHCPTNRQINSVTINWSDIDPFGNSLGHDICYAMTNIGVGWYPELDQWSAYVAAEGFQCEMPYLLGSSSNDAFEGWWMMTCTAH